MPEWPLDKPFDVLAKKCQDAITMSIYGKPFRAMGGRQQRAERGRRRPSRRRGGIVAEAYKAAIRAGITDDQFWSSSLCALRQRIEITFEQQVEDLWTLAWCAAKLNVLAWHDPKKLPAARIFDLGESSRSGIALAAAFGRPGD
jgi:hypothetical protein